MRAIAALLALGAFLSACAAPKPCTLMLCVTRLDGRLETRAWSGVVVSTPGSPQPPVPSDAEVAVLDGSAEFRNRGAKIAAEPGAVFKFSVSTRSVASIEVSAGSVSVVPSTGAAPTTVAPGSRFDLPSR